MKNKAAQAANAPIIFEEIVMIIKIHSENFNVLFYKRSLLNPSNTLIIRSLLQMLNKYCIQSVNVIFTLAILRTLKSRILRTFNGRILRTFSRILRTFNSRILQTFKSRIL